MHSTRGEYPVKAGQTHTATLPLQGRVGLPKAVRGGVPPGPTFLHREVTQSTSAVGLPQGERFGALCRGAARPAAQIAGLPLAEPRVHKRSAHVVGTDFFLWEIMVFLRFAEVAGAIEFGRAFHWASGSGGQFDMTIIGNIIPIVKNFRMELSEGATAASAAAAIASAHSCPATRR